MLRRLARHPAVILTALNAAMLAGSLFVSSTVQAFLVGTSWLGLASPAGIALSIACSLLAMAAVIAIVFFAISGDDGRDDGGGEDEDPPPPPEDPDGDPDWWPEFERELAAYLGDPARSRKSPEHALPRAGHAERS